MSSSKKMVLNTVMLYLMTAAKYLLPLITLPYLTRVLTPEYYGVTTYITSTMSFFQVLVDFGFLYSATREVSVHRNDREYLSSVLSSTIAAKLVLCLVGAVILAVMIPFVEILRQNILLTVLYYISVMVSIFLPDYVYRGLEKMEIVSMRFILARVVSTVLTFVFIHSSEDLLWMPVLTILGNIAAVLFSFAHLYNKENIHLRWVTKKEIITALKQSSVFYAATFATTAYGTLTTFLMGVEHVSTTEIAYWSLAYQIISSIQMLYDPIISSIYPHMVQKKDYGLVKKVLMIFMPVVIVGVIICYFCAEFVMNLVGGPEYIAAVPIFRILLPMLLFSFPAQLVGFPVLASMHKEHWASFSNIISAIFHTIGLFTLIGIGKFTLVNIAILRSCTDAVLLLSRLIIFWLIDKNSGKTI